MKWLGCAFLLLLAPMLMVSPARSQDVEQNSFGTAVTTRATTLRATAAAEGTALRFLAANEPLRWVENEQRNGFLRVIQARGPVGWVAESDLGDVQRAVLVAATIKCDA